MSRRTLPLLLLLLVFGAALVGYLLYPAQVDDARPDGRGPREVARTEAPAMMPVPSDAGCM